MTTQEIVDKILREEVKTIELFGSIRCFEIDLLPANTILCYGGRNPAYQYWMINVGDDNDHA